jgi:butyrate kinase
MDTEVLKLMIPFAGILAGICIATFAIWTSHRQKMFDKQVEMSAEKAAQYAANNQKLEQRVQVLERIITDKGFDISLQIDDLRESSDVKELN